MKYTRYVIFIIICLYGHEIHAQNLLPLTWKISFGDTIKTKITKADINAWEEINLLLSWERQGYFGQNGNCTLATDFFFPKAYENTPQELSIRLHCVVHAIYINGQYLGGKIPNHFWSDKKKYTTFAIPKGLLKTGASNRVIILASKLSYTGGKSYNFCRIQAKDATWKSNVNINFKPVNHVFLSKENIALSLSTKASGKAEALLTIIDDFHDTIVSETLKIKKGSQRIKINLNQYKISPGFYECTTVLHDDGFTGTSGWFAVEPEMIKCTNNTISGYGDYWKQTLQELENIHPNFSIHKVDSLSSGKRDGFVVEMKSLGNITIRGYYFVPRTAGKHPAILHVPGYGYGFQNLSEFLDREEDIVELALCVRGHGISADVFNPGFRVPGIWGYKLCSEKDNAYRSIYMDCVRGVEFLSTRSEIDTTKIGVEGGSQGGGLALATAGLCKAKISALAYFDPFPTDIRDHLKIRRLMEQEITASLRYYNNTCSLEDVLHTQDYLDAKGFAYSISCPVFFAAALYDDDCPPHVGFSAYNRIRTAKRYKIFPEDSHLSESNYKKDFMTFFKSQFEF